MDIMVTGQSLGGALASYVSMRTGARAIAINGAVGYTIDMAYNAENKSNGAAMAKVFTGTEAWNFENHITTSSFPEFNNIVAYRNKECYDSYLYEKADNAELLTYLGSHEVALGASHCIESFLTYDGVKFDFTAGTQIGDKNGKEIIGDISPIRHFYVYLGSSRGDKFTNAYSLSASAYAYGGDGDDILPGSIWDDFHAGGSGANTIDPQNGKDIIAVTDGDDTINDPSGDDTIMLLGDVRISSAVEDGDYYRATLNNGHTLKVNRFRNWLWDGAITVVDENGNTLGKIGGGRPWASANAPAFSAAQNFAPENNYDYPTTKHVEIEGKATLTVYDEDGNVIETFGNDVDAKQYREFGYFYMNDGEEDDEDGEDEEPSITAILFNGKYRIAVEAAETVKYSIYDFDEEDAPRVVLETEVPLAAGQYLDTQSAFGMNDDVPFVIRDSATNEEITILTPTVTNLQDDDDNGGEGDDNGDDGDGDGDGDGNGGDGGGGGGGGNDGSGGCDAGAGIAGLFALALGFAVARRNKTGR